MKLQLNVRRFIVGGELTVNSHCGAGRWRSAQLPPNWINAPAEVLDSRVE